MRRRAHTSPRDFDFPRPGDGGGALHNFPCGGTPRATPHRAPAGARHTRTHAHTRATSRPLRNAHSRDSSPPARTDKVWRVICNKCASFWLSSLLALLIDAKRRPVRARIGDRRNPSAKSDASRAPPLERGARAARGGSGYRPARVLDNTSECCTIYGRT